MIKYRLCECLWEENSGKEMNEKMTKKQKVVFAVVAAVIVLGMILSYIFLMKNQHIDSIPEEKKMPAMSDTERL